MTTLLCCYLSFEQFECTKKFTEQDGHCDTLASLGMRPLFLNIILPYYPLGSHRHPSSFVPHEQQLQLVLKLDGEDKEHPYLTGFCGEYRSWPTSRLSSLHPLQGKVPYKYLWGEQRPRGHTTGLCWSPQGGRERDQASYCRNLDRISAY